MYFNLDKDDSRDHILKTLSTQTLTIQNLVLILQNCLKLKFDMHARPGPLCKFESKLVQYISSGQQSNVKHASHIVIPTNLNAFVHYFSPGPNKSTSQTIIIKQKVGFSQSQCVAVLMLSYTL